MKSAGKARNNGLYRHIRTSKEIIRNLLNDFRNTKKSIMYGILGILLIPQNLICNSMHKCFVFLI